MTEWRNLREDFRNKPLSGNRLLFWSKLGGNERFCFAVHVHQHITKVPLSALKAYNVMF